MVLTIGRQHDSENASRINKGENANEGLSKWHLNAVCVMLWFVE